MKKLLIALLAGALLLTAAPAQAQEPLPGLWDIALDAIEWVVDNGEPAFFYDFAEGESRVGFKLTLVEIKSLIDVDVAALIDRVDRAPGAVAVIGTSLENVLRKVNVDVDLPFDISAGIFAGYDFGGEHEMYGVQLGWRVEF